MNDRIRYRVEYRNGRTETFTTRATREQVERRLSREKRDAALAGDVPTAIKDAYVLDEPDER